MTALLATAVVLLGTFVVARIVDDRNKMKRRQEDELEARWNEARRQQRLRRNGFI